MPVREDTDIFDDTVFKGYFLHLKPLFYVRYPVFNRNAVNWIMASASVQGASALEEHFPYHVLPASAEDVCDIMMFLNLASQNPLDSVVIEVPDFLKFIEYYKNLLIR